MCLSLLVVQWYWGTITIAKMQANVPQPYVPLLLFLNWEIENWMGRPRVWKQQLISDLANLVNNCMRDKIMSHQLRINSLGYWLLSMWSQFYTKNIMSFGSVAIVYTKTSTFYSWKIFGVSGHIQSQKGI